MSKEPETNAPRVESEASGQTAVPETEAAPEATPAAEAVVIEDDKNEPVVLEDSKAEDAAAEDGKEEAPKRGFKLDAASIVGLLASVVILFAIVFSMVRGQAGHGDYALKISNTEYSLGEVNFTYMNIFQQVYSQYAMYTADLLPDDPYTMGDGELDTWGQVYAEETKSHLQQVTVLYERAQEEGVTLDEAELADVESYIQSMKDSAAQTGAEDFDAFLAENYGEGVTEEAVRSIFTREMTAMKYIEHYQDNLDYSKEDIDAAYEADKDTYDTFHFAIFMVEPETDEGAAATDEQMAAAKEKADAILSKAQDGDGEALDRFKAAAETDAKSDDDADKVQTYNMDGGTVTSNQIPFESWLKDPARKDGDMTVSEMTGYGYFVVLFEGRERSETPTVNVRHILIQAEDADGDGEISDAEYDVAKAKIEEIRTEWESGEKTEESFAALAEQYSADPGSNTNGGLYEDVYEGQMVDAFNDFCFDPDRKSGDVGVVQNTVHGGYHLIYFVGAGELSYTDQMIKSALIDEEMSSYIEQLANDLPEAVEGKTFAQVALPASLLEQLQAAKTANTGNDSYTLPAEDETLTDDQLQEVMPEEDLADAPAEQTEDAAQESAAP